jgi:SAM-dependent methyltransferase
VRHTAIAWLQTLGVLPEVYKARALTYALSPKSLARNLQFALGGNRETLSIPGFWARLLVSSSTDVPGFLECGRLGFDCIRETLERNGTPFAVVKDVLDFGCGCGRVLRYWHGHPDKRVHGVDMNDYLVKECRRCVPFATVGTNSMAGKALAYADRSFDLVYAFSVFTHLDLESQRAWLNECRRVLRPGGAFIFSVHGSAFRDRLSEKERGEFDSGRPVVRRGQYTGANLCACFHPESHVRQTMASGFEVVEALPQGAKGNAGQDLYMLRRI